MPRYQVDKEDRLIKNMRRAGRAKTLEMTIFG
jgi:hypothetical protein